MGVLHLRLATLDKGTRSSGVEGVVGVSPTDKGCNPKGGAGGILFLLLDNVGLVRGLVRLVVRERRVGLEIWSPLALSQSCDFFFLCLGLRSPYALPSPPLFLRMSSSLFLRLRA